MKKDSILFFLPVSMFLSILILFNPFANAEELTVLVDEWPPYIDSGAADKGFMSDIVIKAFEHSGIQVRLKFEPWKRVEYNIENHQAVSFGWYFNEDRSRKYYLSEEIIKGLIVFAKRRDNNISWNSLEDLKPYKIGITRTYTGGDEFDRFKSQLQIDEAASDELNLRKLLKGRFDLFVVDPLVGARLLRTKFTAEERGRVEFVTDKPLSSLGIHLVCAKTNDRCMDYIEKFNAGLAAVTEDGTKQKIMEPAMSFQ